MTDWKKKSAMAVVAGGLFGVPAAQAQPINTNLVVNPSFESVDGSLNATTWSGSALGTYLYSQGYTSVNVPPNPGLRYNAGQFGTVSSNTTQSINLVGAGFSAALIDGGLTFSLSSYFSTFNLDNATITARFLDAGSNQLGVSNPIGGAAMMAGLPTGPNINGDPGYFDWAQAGTSGAVPVGTRFVSIDILHSRLSGNANDSYVDLVDFQITAVPEPGTLLLTSSAGISMWLRLRRRNNGKKT